ncbi:MAG: hypothetical protein IT162_20760 [Bryobacterales bacterium]|nr:hypothetical protein [Bryobacterales bacterium]
MMRDAQLAALTDARKAGLAQQAAGLMRQCWPEQCSGLPEEDLLAKVTRGLEAAARWGLTGDQARCCFLNIWFVWGEEFPSEPADAWAVNILENPMGGASAQRVEHLLAQAVEELARPQAALAQGA